MQMPILTVAICSWLGQLPLILPVHTKTRLLECLSKALQNSQLKTSHAVLRTLQTAMLHPCLSVQPWGCRDVGEEQHRCRVSIPRWVKWGDPVLLGHLEDPHHKHLQEGGRQITTSQEHTLQSQPHCSCPPPSSALRGETQRQHLPEKFLVASMVVRMAPCNTQKAERRGVRRATGSPCSQLCVSPVPHTLCWKEAGPQADPTSYP